MSAVSRFSGYVRQFGRDLWILALGWFVAALGFAASIPFISIYFHNRLGMSTTEIGVFFAVMAVVRATFQAMGGELSDRWGRMYFLIHAQYFRAVTFVALGLAIYFDLGFWPIAAALLFNSMFGAVFMTTLQAMVADIVPPKKRLDGYAITRSAGNAGWAAGPAIGGYLAASSYASLFYFSAALTVVCGLIFMFLLKKPPTRTVKDRFKLSDLLALRKDPYLAVYGMLTLALYLVVAQLVAPLSVYVVSMVGLTEESLGHLLTLNGLMVVLLQVPVTRMTERFRLTTLLGGGAILYFVGYSMMGLFPEFYYLALAIIIVTCGELLISPPGMTLVSRLAPEGRTGRYMGVQGFFLTAGWSLGPLYGGVFLDVFQNQWSVAWLTIASLAIVAAVGYFWYARWLPARYNAPQTSLDDE